MARNKFKLTKETIVHEGRTLYRIQALRSFESLQGHVEAGMLGGWVESTANLSQLGRCWIEEDAKAYGNARVTDDAHMNAQAQIYGEARLCDSARMRNYAKAYDYAIIKQKAGLWGQAEVYGAASVKGLARVRQNSKIYDEVTLTDAVVIDGTSQVLGDADIYGEAHVENGYIKSNDDWVTFNNVGSEGGTLTVFTTQETIGRNKKPVYRCTRGCFDGTTTEFLERSKRNHDKTIHKEYKMLIEVAISRMKRHADSDGL